MNIREATECDLPRIIEMGLAFLRAHYADKLQENPNQIEKTARGLLENPNGHILVAENGQGIEGMLAYIMFPHYFSGELFAGELAWWVNPKARGRTGLELLHGFEERARQAGAKKIQMVAPNERVGNLYRRLRFEEVESTFQRALCL